MAATAASDITVACRQKPLRDSMGGPKTRISQVCQAITSGQGFALLSLAVFICTVWLQETFDAAVKENTEEFGMEVCLLSVLSKEHTCSCRRVECILTACTARKRSQSLIYEAARNHIIDTLIC